MKLKISIRSLSLATLVALGFTGMADAESFEYQVVSTSKTSTFEKELNAAAEKGFYLNSIMGGETTFGWREVVAVMQREAGGGTKTKRVYKLLATNKTSTMEKELRELGAAGFEYRGQTAFVTAFRGREVIVILEKDETKPAKRIEYRLVATTRTSTMQKELQEAGAEQFIAVGMTVCKGFVDELEIVTILKKTEDAQGSGKK
jgi:hypothetical protein